MVSKVQAVIFKKQYWKSKEARKWLKKNDFTPIKRVDKTKNYLRYRIRNPDQFKRFAIKSITPSIRLVIGFF